MTRTENRQKWEIVKRIDAGDVMATLIAFVAVLAVFFRLEGQVELNRSDIEDNAVAIEQNTEKIKDLRSDTREDYQRIDDKLDRILERLADEQNR